MSGYELRCSCGAVMDLGDEFDGDESVLHPFVRVHFWHAALTMHTPNGDHVHETERCGKWHQALGMNIDWKCILAKGHPGNCVGPPIYRTTPPPPEEGL